MSIRSELRRLLRSSPIIASVQASDGAAVDDPETLLKLAQCSLAEGVKVLRLQGVANISRICGATGAVAIGLIKRSYAGSPIYITPTEREVEELLATSCAVIAMDFTLRDPDLALRQRDWVQKIQAAGRLAMADCDSVTSMLAAQEAGFDLISTTLSGYTETSAASAGPDFASLRSFVSAANRDSECPILIAEGRFSERWEVQAALATGADAVVIGGAINDPVKQTRRFVSAVPVAGRVAAVDIGGTWMRFGVQVASGEWECLVKEPLVFGRQERLDWINAQAMTAGVDRVGISSGGTIDPVSATVVEAKPIIPNHEGTCFRWEGLRSVALNDGLATAWGHAMHPTYAGMRVASMALGTGVGFGLVDRGRILMGPHGEYPRLNDQWLGQAGTYEDQLGGLQLTTNPTQEQRILAQQAFDQAVQMVRSLYYPDVVVVCGGVGLSDWLQLPSEVVRSPYGSMAGLEGAAQLVRNPPSL